MKKIKAVTIVLLFLFCGQVLAQQKTTTAIDDNKTFKLFFEKTYVQTDRVYYSSGEDIWFSAYLVNGKSTSLTSTSNNLYVELINSKAQPIDNKLIRLNGGLGNGDFKLKDSLQTGWYTIRAYTNWMRNFGNDFVFQKKIYVNNTLAAKGTNASTISSGKTENAVVANSKKTITFFPEGGSLIEGLTSIVAFKTNDEFGNGLEARGSIISSKGDTVTTFQSKATGMGIFAFMPLPNEKYRVEGFFNAEKFNSTLPVAIRKGFSLHLTTDSASIKVAISTNDASFAEFQGKPISIVIKHAGDNVYTGTINLTKPSASVTIPTNDLPTGVAVLTLLDHLGRPNGERLVYIQSANKVNFTVSPTKSAYAAREQVTLNVKATNAMGQPVKTNFSMAVVDGIIPNDPTNIVSYLMLQSEIKGEIKNADQYFDPQNAARFKQLDLLLLTQGWREYLWRKLADSTISVANMPEPGITIRGTVREKLGNKPMPDMNITLFGSGFVGNKLYTTKTDAAGRYFLDGLNWSGYQAIKLSSQDNKGKKGGWLQIDSVAKPFPINLKKPNPFEIPGNLNTEINTRMAYNRKFKVGDSIMLDEVKIVGEKRETILLPDGGSLMTFGYKDQVFNITAADYVFKGLEHFLLTKAELARPIPIDDSTGNEGIYFGSSRPLILVNNRLDLQDRLDYYSLTMDQINKIVIKHLINTKGDDVFVMYLDLKDNALRGPNLHLLNIGLTGYYSAKTFYSPNHISKEASIKDFRTTLFWAPLLKTNEKGEVSVSFYNSDNKGDVNVKIDGVTEQGTAVAAQIILQGSVIMNKNIIKIALLISCFSTFVSQAQNAKRPNIIVILADDMGYSDIGCFGSETRTPNLDEMAAKGLKMTQFYNASRCCPTRASLLTGLYQHQAGVGDMMNTRKEPAYQGYLNKNCVTIAEALKPYGYTTLMAGKWHVGQAPENWPVKRGFDRYFGLIDGAGSYFGPYPYRPKQKLTIALDDQEYTPGKDYYSTNAYTDYAIKFIDDNSKTKKPFFLYLAYQAPHWPLQALPQDIAKYKGKYMQGWDKLREARFKKMQEMGIIPKNIKLSPRDSNLPEWDSLSQEEKLNWDDKMAVYAAMLDCMDQNIGRIRKKLKELGQDKNTVIMFLSDNGASNENINPNGFLRDIFQSSKKLASDPTSFTAYGFEGANVSNTPFRLFKHWEYEGGTATPFIAYGPNLIKPGITSHQPGHIIDIMTTCLNLAGAKYPAIYKENQIKQTVGVNLVPLFKGQKWVGHNALFFEHEGNRAVRQGDWKLVSNYPDNEWHLFNMVSDRTELNDLSKNQPQKVKELITLYNNWAQKSDVISFEKLATKKGEGY